MTSPLTKIPKRWRKRIGITVGIVGFIGSSLTIWVFLESRSSDPVAVAASSPTPSGCDVDGDCLSPIRPGKRGNDNEKTKRASASSASETDSRAAVNNATKSRATTTTKVASKVEISTGVDPTEDTTDGAAATPTPTLAPSPGPTPGLPDEKTCPDDEVELATPPATVTESTARNGVAAEETPAPTPAPVTPSPSPSPSPTEPPSPTPTPPGEPPGSC